MKTIEEMLSQIPDEQEREQLINIMQIIEDPLSRDILGKLASPHSPILANKIPDELFNHPKINVLSRIKKMMNMELIESTFETSGKGIAYKKYDITEYGEKIASIHAKYETEKHSQLLSKTL